MTHHFQFGAKPRKPDPRDYKAALVLPSTTVVGRKLWDKPIQLDQGPYGTCVAQAWTHLLTDDPVEHPEKWLLDPANQPSYTRLGSSAYWVDQQTGDYTGVPVRAELYAVRLYDAIHDGLLEPLDPERNDGCSTQDGATVLARRGLISAYYRLENAEAVVQAVLTHGPVVFASPWYHSMFNTHLDGDTRWVNVDPATGIAGYHAYVIDGADNTSSVVRIRLHNSWGVVWGNKGSAWLTLDELRVLWIDQAFLATEPSPA
jgi:hypothetical protein